MPEEFSPGTEVFSHMHHAGVNAIKAVRADLPRADDSPDAFLINDLRDFLQQLELGLEEDAQSPIAAAQAAISAFGRAEAKAFVLSNLLEQLKRGDKAPEVLERFQRIGLAEAPPTPAPSVIPTGGIVQRLGRSLAKAGNAILGILINAIKHVPALAKLKIKPIIGFSGVFPTVAVQLDIEADSISIAELFRVLGGKQQPQ